MSSTANPILPPFSAPFDDEIGLEFTELGPDGVRAQLELRPKLWQPTGIVHGGVYCS
ncbi:MAG: esterase, partial [Mycobacterium sp.]